MVIDGLGYSFGVLLEPIQREFKVTKLLLGYGCTYTVKSFPGLFPLTLETNMKDILQAGNSQEKKSDLKPIDQKSHFD